MTVWQHGYAVSGDDRIYWESGGRCIPVVLCHGAGSNHVSFYQQMAGMASDRVRVIVWDQRGYGNSTRNGSAIGPRAGAEDLSAVLASAGVEGPVHVIGQAMGAFVAAAWAIDHPERAASLALWDGPFRIGEDGAAMIWSLKSDGEAVRISHADPKIGRTSAVGADFAERDPVHTYLYQTLQKLGNAQPGYAEMFPVLEAQPIPIAGLAGLDMPILIGRGEFDTVADPDAYAELAARIPGARLVTLKGAGHSPYFETADQWNRCVLDHVGAAQAEMEKA